MKKIYLYILFFSIIQGTWAQEHLSDTLEIEEAVVTSPRLINFTTGAKVQRIGKLAKELNRGNSIADLLNDFSIASIKSYGVDGLTSVSLRGAGSNHTAVVWNGFNLQSPMNGGIDMAQLPAGFMDDIQVQYGGAGALYGSGCIGGIVHLNNTISTHKGFSANFTQQGGSFNTFSTLASVKIGTGKTGHGIKVYYKTADNNFEFTNNQQINSPTQKTNNAQVKKLGLLQSNNFKVGKGNIETNLWYQLNDKHIPPNMFKKTNKASQEDQNIRGIINYRHPWKHHLLAVKNGIFVEQTQYNDPEMPSEQANSLSKAYTSRTEIENLFRINNHLQLNAGVNYAYIWADVDDYPSNTDQQRASVFTSFKAFTNNKKWATTINFRKEWVDDHFTPFIPAIGIRYSPDKTLTLQGNISRNYRLPTFNELYWANWGNPDLKPEDGYSTDLGLQWLITRKNMHLKLSSSIFHSRVKDWIIWVPGLGNWSPQNVQKVWSRGVEAEAKWALQLTHFQTQLFVQYGYTRSTNESEQTGINGKQLIYVPKHEAKGNVRMQYKSWYINYSHGYVGQRYITADHSGLPIKGYQIGNLKLGKSLNYQNLSMQIAADINNLWDSDYQVMAFYPMPLRNYGLTIHFDIN